MAGLEQDITILPGLAFEAYGRETTTEKFSCGFGLNEEYRDIVFSGELKITGIGPNGDVRIAELPGRSFYLATLFLPQLVSLPGDPHPLFSAFLKSAASDQDKAE